MNVRWHCPQSQHLPAHGLALSVSLSTLYIGTLPQKDLNSHTYYIYFCAPGMAMVDGCCNSIYYVFGNDSSGTDLVSDPSFTQLQCRALRYIVDAGKT